MEFEDGAPFVFVVLSLARAGQFMHALRPGESERSAMSLFRFVKLSWGHLGPPRRCLLYTTCLYALPWWLSRGLATPQDARDIGPEEHLTFIATFLAAGKGLSMFLARGAERCQD